MADDFRRLEARLMEPGVRRSPEQVGRLLTDDFLEFGRSGTVYDRRQIIELLSREEPQDEDLVVRDFVARPLSNGVTLVTYRTVRSDPPDGRHVHTLRSSIWKLVDGEWRMAFHQGTPTDA